MKELIFVIFGLSFFSVKAQTLEIYPTNTVAEINAKLKGLSGKGIVHFNEGVYLFKDVQKIQIKNNNLKLIGEGRGKTIFKFSDSTIVYNGFIQIDTASNIVIENISFDANNLNSSRSGIILTQKSNDVSILNNEFKNLHNNNGMMYAINIPAINVKNFVIKNNSFSNISSLGDSIIGTNEGMSGAILIHVGKIKPTDFPSNGRISYNHIENIFLDQSNGYKDYDSDGIRFFIPNNSEKFDKIYKKTVIIEYNQIINVQKSGVKSQSFPGLVIKDNYIFSDREDFSMFAGIRIYGKDHMSQHILIKNNKIKGNILHGFVINGKNIKIDGLEFEGYSDKTYDVVQIGYADSTSHIRIKNISAKNAKDGFVIYTKSNLVSIKNCNFSNISGLIVKDEKGKPGKAKIKNSKINKL